MGIGLGILLLFILFILGIACCYWWISHIARPYIYDSIEALPYRETALLLGTAKYVSDGRINHFYSYRVARAIAIYKKGKTGKILISGADKISQTPDEVDMMFDSLLHQGARESDLLTDHEGNRTWNSLLHCKMKYKILNPTIVSQQFHNERAVFIALKMGMQPLAINATRVTGRAGVRIILRESLARVKCLMDCYLLKSPLAR